MIWNESVEVMLLKLWLCRFFDIINSITTNDFSKKSYVWLTVKSFNSDYVEITIQIHRKKLISVDDKNIENTAKKLQQQIDTWKTIIILQQIDYFAFLRKFCIYEWQILDIFTIQILNWRLIT